MIRIQLRKNEPLEKTLRRFKRICDNEEVFSQLKRNTYYEKPSDRKRREQKERMKNMRKSQYKNRKFSR